MSPTAATVYHLHELREGRAHMAPRLDGGPKTVKKRAMAFNRSTSLLNPLPANGRARIVFCLSSTYYKNVTMLGNIRTQAFSGLTGNEAISTLWRGCDRSERCWETSSDLDR